MEKWEQGMRKGELDRAVSLRRVWVRHECKVKCIWLVKGSWIWWVDIGWCHSFWLISNNTIILILLWSKRNGQLIYNFNFLT